MAQTQATIPRNPRVGMLAIVRKRRAVISEVQPFDGQEGVLHLIRLDYKDDSRPETEELIWELEPARRLLEPNELPRASAPPMPAEDFDALIRSARWTAISPYLDPDADGPLERMPICSPFHGAVQVEDYQLIPLLKALQMPRITLLIADDVGIGKTIEAGLIKSELIIRRRVQRILIITPASLRIQWRDEMWSKFSLRFDVIDRDSTMKLKRSLGIDANPWRSCPRIIASYHYLKQPDVLEQFRSACRTSEDSPQLPWDMLVVDEVHNLMPSPFGEDSELCNMLRMIAPQFEHRLFLTATPHNGHTRCFSGLLELLDPVRFSRTDELKPAEKERIKQVVIRRLKREINARTKPPRFCTRKPPQAVMLKFSPAELRLIQAVGRLRVKVRSVIAGESKKRRLAGTFAIEILGKRLLSGPIAFADSWRRCKLGLAEDEPAGDSDVVAAEKTVHEDTADDREYQQREATASAVIGAWLKAIAGDIQSEILDTDKAVAGLGLDLDHADVMGQNPSDDARFQELCKLIDQLLRKGKDWKPDERLVLFTEYKTTLDYLLRRLSLLSDSIKASSNLPEGMDSRTIAAVYFAWAFGRLREILPEPAATGFFINVAAPMSHFEKAGLKDRYLQIIQAAWHLSFSGGKAPICQGISIAKARKALIPLLEQTVVGTQERRFEVLPETIAPVVSLSLDPLMQAGMYMIVDTGAGTTEMSVFHAGESGADQKILCYRDETMLLGGNDLQLADRLEGRQRLQETCRITTRIEKHYRRIWQLGYCTDKANHLARRRWQELTLVLSGGGTRHNSVREQLCKANPITPWPKNETRLHVVRHCPGTLETEGCVDENEGSLFAVANGLAVERMHWPIIFSPNTIEELEPTERTEDKPEAYWYLD